MSNYYSHETTEPENHILPPKHFLPLDITAAVRQPLMPYQQPSFRSSTENQGYSKLRQYHEAKLSARAVAKERE